MKSSQVPDSREAAAPASGELLRYMPQLDGLRALAVLFVIYSHWVPKVYQGHIAWGVIGVQLFFVLSGFLITGILLNVRDGVVDSRSRWVALKVFFARRFLRIFPLYYAVVFAVTAFGLFATRETFWYNITYTTNIYFFVNNDWNLTVGHFWSLAVEEQFYLVWPWVILFAPRRRLGGILVGVIACSIILKLVLAGLLPQNIFVSKLPFGAWDALGGGALLAVLSPGSVLWKRWVWGSLGGGLLVWCLSFVLTSGVPGSMIAEWRQVGLVFMCVWVVGRLVVGEKTIIGQVLSRPVLVGVGVISYGLYILHPFVPILWGKLVERLDLPAVLVTSFPVRMTACFIFLFSLASLSWFAYEKPLNRLKRRFLYLSGENRPV